MFSTVLTTNLMTLGLATMTTALLTPLFIFLAPSLGLMDIPNERCIHKNITPRGGGVVVFLAFNAACYFIYQRIGADFIGQLNLSWWLAFLASSTLLIAVGIVDDRTGMSPMTKLAGQAAATACLYFLTDTHVNLLGLDFGLLGGLVIALIWTLAIVNAFNLIDGLDGLCSGLAMISAIGLAAVFFLRGNSDDGLVCLALVGACIGFLYHNFHPAKVFLGDTGSMFLGFALASISLQSGGKVSLSVLLAAPFFIAGIPVIDTLLAIWRRSIRKEIAKREGQISHVKVTQADKEHLHHRLLNYGLKQHHVALVLYAINLVIVSLGLLFFMFNELATGFFFIAVILSLYLLIKYVLQIELWETHRLMASSDNNPEMTRFSLMCYPVFDLAWMSAAVWLAGNIARPGQPSGSFYVGVTDLLLWIVPTFTLLFASHAYIKIWRNSFFKDYFLLLLAVLAGCTISMALHFLLHIHSGSLLVNQWLLFSFFTLLGIVGARIPHHVVREWGLNNPSPIAQAQAPRNILLYGAGNRGGAYIRKRYLYHAHELGATHIVGFIDDNTFLRNQYTYGKLVLGDLNDLNDLIAKHRVDEIVLTTDISDDNLATLKNIADQHRIDLYEWRTCTMPLTTTDAIPKTCEH